MINTETNINANIKQPLKMIPFNLKTFVKTSCSIMETYIGDLEHSKNKVINKLPVDLSLALNKNGKLIICANEQSSVCHEHRFAICKKIDKRLLCRHKNETSQKWAIRILNNYCKWLQSCYQRQANADYPMPIRVSHNHSRVQLYTNQDYIAYTMQRLDEITDTTDIDTIAFSNKYGLQYGMQMFIAKIKQFKTIHRSLLSRIVEHLEFTIDYIDDSTSSAILVVFLQTLIDVLNGKKDFPKIVVTNKQEQYNKINFALLMQLCNEYHITITTLPFEALGYYVINCQENKQQSHMSFTIRDVNDLKYPYYRNSNAYDEQSDAIWTYLDNKSTNLVINFNGYRQELAELVNKSLDNSDLAYQKLLVLQKVLDTYSK